MERTVALGETGSDAHRLSPCSGGGRPEICLLQALPEGSLGFIQAPRMESGGGADCMSAALSLFSSMVYLAPSPLLRMLGQVQSVQVLLVDLFVDATVISEF